MKCILSILVAAILFSCHSTKNVQASRTEQDSSWIKLATKLESENGILKEENQRLIKESSETGIVFESVPCPNIDSLLTLDSAGRENARREISSLQNELEISADGTIKAKGSIKSYKQSAERLERELSSRDAAIQRLRTERDSLAVQTHKEVETKTVVKKVQFIPWWMFVIAGLGYLIFALGIIPKLRSKFRL